MSKYCPNCSAPLDDDDIFCGECGTKLEQPQFNPSTINSINKKETTKPMEIESLNSLKPKNKLVAGLLAIFLGWCGAHWFYLNKPIRAIIYLVVYFIFPYIWVLYIAEGIYFLCISSEKFDAYRAKGNAIW